MNGFRLVAITQEKIAEKLRHSDFDFLAAISFEERSTWGAKCLWKSKLLPRRVYLIDYDTVVEPEIEAQELRKGSRSKFEEYFSSQARIDSLGSVNAFAATKLAGLTSRIIQHTDDRPLVIDITCLTRVHLFGLVTALAKMDHMVRDLYVCYSTPQSYGFEKGVMLGWQDVLFIPIGKMRLFKREGHARGLILAGHYGERLSVALQELEPALGTLIYTKVRQRPDLLLRAREANSFITSRLLTLKMPRTEARTGIGEGWREETILLNDLDSLTSIIEREVDAARSDRGPIVLYPFGPKPMALSAALTLCNWPDTEAWAVYPVPEKFDAAYSTGVDSLIIYKVQGGIKA